MKPAYSETKSDAWDLVSRSKFIAQKEIEIMRLFTSLDVVLSRNDIGRILKCPPSHITSTIASLIAKNKLVERGKAKDKVTNISNFVLGLPVPVQLDLLVVA
jgi:hypothetical protein